MLLRIAWREVLTRTRLVHKAVLGVLRTVVYETMISFGALSLLLGIKTIKSKNLAAIFFCTKPIVNFQLSTYI